ncbi:MAG: MlaD family protein, partial [Bacteroidota bacterium]
MQHIKTEVKIGIIVLTTLAVVIWGINFLKGKNILNRTDVYYGVFKDIQGIDVSAPVLINGYKVGMVSKISFSKGELDKLIIAFTASEKYAIPEASVVELHSADLLGTMALRIIPSENDSYHEYGYTLISAVEKDMLTSITDQFIPLKTRAESVLEEVDSLLHSLNYVLDQRTSNDLKSALANLNHISEQLKGQLGQNGNLYETFESLNLISKKLSENRSKLD